ncbi:hypothetical protein [Allorhizocola rhizosphaerae]|nr:hypothetical protein [Allorhizocola rhizosphaerae]
MDGRSWALLIADLAGVLIFVVRLTALLRGWSAQRPRLSGATDATADQ